MAACVEEVDQGQHLVIRFAANSGNHDFLSNGLQKISNILQDEARDIRRITNKKIIFEEIVKLDQNRILARVRSRHAKSYKARGKATLLDRLKTAERVLKRSSLAPSHHTKAMADQVDTLQSQFDNLENTNVEDVSSREFVKHLSILVANIHFFFVAYEEDLKSTPCAPGIWDDKATESLIDRLRKISRYFKTCDELLKIARRYPVLSTIVVQFVDLQRSDTRISASSNIDRAIVTGCPSEMILKASRRLHQSTKDICKGIASRLAETSRIHAEIQLSLFYELNGSLQKPRVICSSKRACYLCNLFIDLQGQYHIPSTHGRLYDAWRWPTVSPISSELHQSRDVVHFAQLLSKFSEMIYYEVENCLSRPHPGKRTEPLESSVDGLATITPSVRSHIFSHSPGALPSAAVKIEDNYNEGASMGIEIPDGVRDSLEIPALRPALLHAISTRSTSSDSSTTLAVKAGRKSIDLKQDETIHYLFDKTHSSLQVYAPHLHLDLQYSVSSRAASHPTLVEPGSEFVLKVERMTLPTGDHIREDMGDIMDLGEGDWVEMTTPENSLFQPHGLLLKSKDTLLRLSVRQT